MQEKNRKAEQEKKKKVEEEKQTIEEEIHHKCVITPQQTEVSL